ncbi:hypothetical protein HFO65_15710 [Rhizobium laguerreae]|uniref:hypothetical protein n=1 Tax=Rhizobium laguerreae TaxID=1076926 RepID=UPI001C9187B7|nr:hypothetical protein [Rhizobium laguerreae]MBY3162080.1 hypothetical protein [Rhizobium laguerreae]
MGREVRKVPANWEHPKKLDSYGRERLQPMFDMTFADAAAEWKENFMKWEGGDRPSHFTGEDESLEYWEWENNPPDRAYYRPWTDEDAIWFQVWETVSEGTPVSPPFETEEELIAYLAANGDFWDQKRCKEPGWEGLWGGTPGVSGWGRERAERFVKAAWAPSMILTNGKLVDGKFAV